MDKEVSWRNRIIESGELPANQFLAHPENARRHPAKQREALRGSLNELGWVARVLVSARTGRVLDGHARIEEALSVDEELLIPFDKLDVSEDEERLILAYFDPITNQAEYDPESLDILLSQVRTEEPGLVDLLKTLAAEHGLGKSGNLKNRPTDPLPNMAWVLVGIPLVRYSEIAQTIEGLAKRPEVQCITSVSGNAADPKQSSPQATK